MLNIFGVYPLSQWLDSSLWDVSKWIQISICHRCVFLLFVVFLNWSVPWMARSWTVQEKQFVKNHHEEVNAFVVGEWVGVDPQMIIPVLKRFPFRTKNQQKFITNLDHLNGLIDTYWQYSYIRNVTHENSSMISRSIHLFTISARIVKSWIRFWPRWRSVPGNGEDKLLLERLGEKFVQNMCILPKKSQGEDFSGGTSCEWPVIFRNTSFFLWSLDDDLSLDDLSLVAFFGAESVTWPTGLWWSTACGGDLVIYLLDAIEAWDAGGLLERLREDLGSPSTLAKAGRWWMGWREPWRWMPWNWIWGLDVFWKSRLQQNPFLIWFCEKGFIFVMSKMCLLGWFSSKTESFYDVKWAL